MKYPDDFINKIICGDCLEVMKEMPDESIDMVLTSPPYDDLRDYKGYTFNFEGIAKELNRIIKQGGVIVWVVKDSVKDGKTLTSFKQALHFQAIGLNCHDIIIWEKDAFSFPDKTRYRDVFEYVFIFAKGKPKIINIIKITQYFFIKKPHYDCIIYPRKRQNFYVFKFFSKLGNRA